MRERPILFSGPMVRALLAGTKLQTRRVVKHKWPHLWREPHYPTGRVLSDLPTQPGAFMEFRHRQQDEPGYQGSPASTLVPCPYGHPGDRLWVREAWARTTVFPGTEMVVYREGDNRTDYGGPWKPSIHLFRRDSRILLEITEVRVERLQDISRGDAMAEGCPFPNMAQGDDPRSWYAALWDQINGAGAWTTNPWVWVVSFRRLENTHA